MKKSTWQAKMLAAGLVSTIVLIGWVMLSGAQEHASSPSAPPTKTAEQQFKNIQVLKDIPADQVIPSMQFIASSLGVGCDFCHVEHQMDKDDKKTKQTARKMIAMQVAIDKNNFNGELEVTCYTCHRGTAHPVAIPILSADTAKMPAATAHEHEHEHEAEGDEHAEHANLPSADQLFEKYLAAVGGADAVNKIKTRLQKGTIDAFGSQYPIEVYSEAPEKRLSITHPQSGPSVTAFNGEVGWLTTPGGVHRMSPAENEAARIDATLHFPVKVREMYQDFQVRPGEEIAGRPTVEVRGTAKGKPTLRLFFDQENGLLLRSIRYAETPLGRNPTQIDYADYRAADGVKIPYRWTLARPGGSFTIKIEQVQQNVPVDEKLFVPPAEPPPAPAK
jgi:photosynthetic reaction center cytochrome c subunit